MRGLSNYAIRSVGRQVEPVISLIHNSRIFSMCTISVLLYLLVSPSLLAAITAEKSPNDVYVEVQLLVDDLRDLRKQNKITTPWPRVKVESGRKPRHVFQKALEVLGEINSYRLNIAKTGGITVPRFPGRDITPNEVFSVVVRLRQELALLLKKDKVGKIKKKPSLLSNKTSNHVYAALSEVSIAIEETLGLRGVTPSEVYTRSLQVIRLVQFLRRSQSLTQNVPVPELTQGKLSNHALASVYKLLEKIRQVEKNLWMVPLKKRVLPRRVITPSDVFDEMGVAIAELQSIQFRLGLERDFPEPEPQEGKTPDDVIQNTRWAAALLPSFELNQPLQQYNRMALLKTPNHVFSISEHILKKLKQYRRLRGIQVIPRKANKITGMQPRHVYSKTLEILEKVSVLRERQGLGEMAVPQYPLRTITPSEVYDLTLRLDNELELIFKQEAMDTVLWNKIVNQVGEYEDKQPSDVYRNMQQILYLLDVILGSEGSTPNDVYREVLTIKQDIELIAKSLGEKIPVNLWSDIKLKPQTQPREVLLKAAEVLDLIFQAKRRAGMFGLHRIKLYAGDIITPTDVFKQVRLIETELTELKVFIGIDVMPEPVPRQQNKTPADVLRVLEGIITSLKIILHQGGVAS